jgi:hypothetical protein
MKLKKLINNTEYRSISYAIGVQNFIFSLLGLSLGIYFVLILFTNPFDQVWAFWAFWINNFVFLSAIISYFQFWYYFSLKSSIIYVSKVNKMIFSSTGYSAIFTLLLTIIHTNQLNLLTGTIFTMLLILIFIIYR